MNRLLHCCLLYLGLLLAQGGGHAAAASRPVKQLYAYVFSSQDFRPLAHRVCLYRVEASGKLAPSTPFTVQTGNSPETISVDPVTRSVYISSADDEGTSDFIRQYTIDGHGGLKPLAPPSVNAMMLLGAQALSPIGKFFYVSGGKANVAGRVLAPYRVSGDGTLHQMPSAQVKLSDSFVLMMVDPTGRFLYAIDNSPSGVVPYILQYRIQPGGTLRPLSPASIETGTLYYAYLMGMDAGFKEVFVVGNMGVLTYKIRPNGTLSYVENNVGRVDWTINAIAYDQARHTLYGTAQAYGGNADTNGPHQYLVAYKFDRSGRFVETRVNWISNDGRLTPTGKPLPLAGATDFTGLAVSPDGSRLYLYDGSQDRFFVLNLGRGGLPSPRAEVYPSGIDLGDFLATIVFVSASH